MLMRRLPDIAIRECVGELRAACRLPIEPQALDQLIEQLRHNFDRILANPEGMKRWADHGQRMRDNARHLGALADFYGNREGVVSVETLNRAFQAVRQDCTVRAESTPLAYEYCRPPGGGLTNEDSTRRDESRPVRDRVPEPV